MSRINTLYNNNPPPPPMHLSRTEVLSAVHGNGAPSSIMMTSRDDAPPTYEDAMEIDTTPIAVPIDGRRSSFFAPIITTSTKVDGTHLQVINEVKYPSVVLLAFPISLVVFIVLLIIFKTPNIGALIALLVCGAVYVRHLMNDNPTIEYLTSLGKHTTWQDIEKYITIMADSPLRLFLFVECSHMVKNKNSSHKKVTYTERVPYTAFTETDATTFDASSIKSLQNHLDTMATSYLEFDSSIILEENDCDIPIRDALQRLRDKHKHRDVTCEVKLESEIAAMQAHMMVLAKPHKKSIFVNRTCYFIWASLLSAYCYIIQFERCTSTCKLEFTRSLRKVEEA